MQPITSPVMQDIMEASDEKELWIVGREFERPPYFHAGKGGDTRLTRALRLCTEDKITPNSDGSYQVQGSEGRSYRVAESCSCPNSQKASSRWCYHAVGVALYVEWQRRLRPVAPVDLGTLRAGTAPMSRVPTPDDDELGNGFPVDDETLPLPLPPVTVDERLAAAAHDAQARARALDALPLIAHREEGPVSTTSEGVPYTFDERTHVRTPHTPQEDRMADDQYIPEPEMDDAPVATLEAPTPVPALRPRAPQVDDLEAALQVWTTERAVVQRFLKQELKANIDYYTLRIGGKDSKPSLSKAGAEKVMGWLKLQASFLPDTGTWEMLGRPTDLVCFVCTIRTRSGEIVGEGRGARSVKKDNGDINKAIKMAEKSACVSAVLRTGALSDVFTCDLEDMQEEPAKAPARPPYAQGTSQEMRQKIWAQVQELAPDVKTREAVEAWVLARTGVRLLPDNYAHILTSLEGKA
jgi:hypothetical protein